MSSLRTFGTAVAKSILKTVGKPLAALGLLCGACFLPAVAGAESGDYKVPGRGRALASKRETKAKVQEERYSSDAITEAEHWDYAGRQIDLMEAGKITKEEASKRCAASRAKMRNDKPGMTEKEYNATFAAIQKKLDSGKISEDEARQECFELRRKASIFRIFRVSNPKLQRYCECEKSAYDGVVVGKITEDKAKEALAKIRVNLWPKGKDEYKAYKLEK